MNEGIEMAQGSASLKDVGLSLSPIGFGCAGLMRLPSARARRELITAAIDAGITHFDVARMYGLGAAEAELGRALRDRRQELTIATKFGIDASGSLRRIGRLQAPARALLAHSPKLRSSVRARRDSFATPRRYDADTARISLDRSLKELGVEHVDILFLHDPRPHDTIERGALLEFLKAARSAGKLRAWGSSLDSVSGAQQMANLPEGGLLQTRIDPLEPAPPSGAALVFGVMGEHAAITTWLKRRPEAHREWSETLGGDPLSDDLLATLLLSQAMQAMASPAAPVALYATTRVSRLRIAARVISSPPDPARVQALTSLLGANREAILGVGRAGGGPAP